MNNAKECLNGGPRARGSGAFVRGESVVDRQLFRSIGLRLSKFKARGMGALMSGRAVMLQLLGVKERVQSLIRQLKAIEMRGYRQIDQGQDFTHFSYNVCSY